MQASFTQGNPQQALSIHQTISPLIRLLACETNPIPLKAALSTLGICNNVLRLPLSPVSKTNYEKIQQAMKDCIAKLKEMDLFDE